MKMNQELKEFEEYLRMQEKSRNTVEKYLRDVGRFLAFACGSRKGEREEEILNRRLTLEYKEELLKRYQTTSVNSMLIAVNCYLKFIGHAEWKLQTVRVQRQIFRPEEKELTRNEYCRLVREASQKGKSRLCHILQTIGATGIRISELRFVTVEALKSKIVRIYCKGKERIILLPCSLVRLLTDYCRKKKIVSGSIFITRNGNPVDRRNIWAEMKSLCRLARVQESKVFPHNLRHLFARCYYEKEKDLVRLADYLGHSSVETTRRYTKTASMKACLKQLELGLLPDEPAVFRE
ncbi:MAG TPA: site-specific integrase [Candidatus Enterocloster faecavium]|uniref:Site-specific integrase n=1 Tax=Candidatus Enterocloster faecavium TaxID=2838560 RepID=A0A9D2L9V5_9FIRM|nr:site-specific integrase [Candidatus Enterocloster faecavium]